MRRIIFRATRVILWLLFFDCSKFDTSLKNFTIEMLEFEDHYSISINYADLYQKKQILQWISGYMHLLTCVTHNPDLLIKDMELMGNLDKKKLLRMGMGTENKGEFDNPAQIINKAILNYSNHPAIWFEGKEITYKELNIQVEASAYHLDTLGVKKGDVVGVLLPRSPYIITTLLAIQRLGLCWLPIDNGLPEERIGYMLTKSNTKFLIMEFNENQKEYSGIIQIDINSITGLDNITKAPMVAEGSNLSYILFTSGSTGVPKGVEIENHSVANFIYSMLYYVKWEEKARMACVTSCSFDIFLFEVLCSLVSGGCIVLFGENDTNDPKRFAEIVEQADVDYLQMTPTRLQLMSMDEYSSHTILSNVRKLVLGGEAFPVQLLDRLQSYKNMSIYNIYAPTETCIYSIFKEMTHAEKVTIGRPILNTKVYILDIKHNLLPEGEKGLLWIGGLGVARGYINEPEMTGRRFIDNPFGDGRIYNTGDIAMWENGELVLFGRADSQVKIRGYRVELDEIENVIKINYRVENAVVVVRVLSGGNQTLVSYIVEKEGQEVDIQELRQCINNKLPYYMMPSLFIKLDSFPQTQSGKADRVLMATEEYITKHVTEKNDNGQRLQDSAELKHLEEKLYDIWCKVLGSNNFDISDNYFDAGGNSFSIIVLHSEFDKLFPSLIDVSDLFINTSIYSQCRLIIEKIEKKAREQDSKKKYESETVIIESDLNHSLSHFCSNYKLKSQEVLTAFFLIYLNNSYKESKFKIYRVSEAEIKIAEIDFRKVTNLEGLFHLLKIQTTVKQGDMYMGREKKDSMQIAIMDRVCESKEIEENLDIILQIKGDMEQLTELSVLRRNESSDVSIKKFTQNYFNFFKRSINNIVEKEN